LAFVFHWAPSELYAIPIRELEPWLDQARKILKQQAKQNGGR